MGGALEAVSAAQAIEERVDVAAVEWAAVSRAPARSDKIALAGAAREGAQGAHVCALFVCAPWLSGRDWAAGSSGGAGFGGGGAWGGLRILEIIGHGHRGIKTGGPSVWCAVLDAARAAGRGARFFTSGRAAGAGAIATGRLQPATL